MGSQNSYVGIDRYAADLIRYKAKKLAGTAGFTKDDIPDIEQELVVDLLQRMRHFNPAKAKKTTFIALIIERHILTILDFRFAQCRDWRLCQTSLNETLNDEESDTTEMIELVDSDDFLGRTDREPLEQFASEIRIDVERAIESLSTELRKMCVRLSENTMVEIARELGIPRSTLYDRRTKLQEAFREAGLDDYL